MLTWCDNLQRSKPEIWREFNDWLCQMARVFGINGKGGESWGHHMLDSRSFPSFTGFSQGTNHVSIEQLYSKWIEAIDSAEDMCIAT